MNMQDITLKGTFMSDEDVFKEWMRGNLIENIDGNNVKNEINWISSMLEEDEGINFNIDSIGGDYKHGWIVRYAIQDLIKKGIHVTMTAIGNVGSTASMVFMSVPKENRYVKRGSTGFIHNPSMVVVGDAKEHEMIARVLRDTENEMSEYYAKDMGISVEQAKKYMNDETLFSTKMMVDSGFAGHIIEDKETEKETQMISALWQKSCINGQCNIQAKEEEKFKNFINQL